jgi:hypothetical protein
MKGRFLFDSCQPKRCRRIRASEVLAATVVMIIGFFLSCMIDHKKTLLSATQGQNLSHILHQG